MQKNENETGPVSRLIEPRNLDFGGFPVRRSLPRRGVEGVGPWVFFDHMGPRRFLPGEGVDVIPHPHINLATVTYLFDGEILHRDSIGSEQLITPGAVNLMFAGRGIAHSERTPHSLRTAGHTLHGLQLWQAVPEEREEDQPSFLHYTAGQLPRLRIDRCSVRVMIGEAWGLRSPVLTLSPTLYAEARIPAGAVLALPEADERGIYCVRGAASVDGVSVGERRLALLSAGAGEIGAEEDALVVLIGGRPLGRRYMWWNFVSSRTERIEEAKADWKERRFPPVAGDREEYAPLPESDSYARMKSEDQPSR